jgi:hypothetical protein
MGRSRFEQATHSMRRYSRWDDTLMLEKTAPTVESVPACDGIQWKEKRIIVQRSRS